MIALPVGPTLKSCSLWAVTASAFDHTMSPASDRRATSPEFQYPPSDGVPLSGSLSTPTTYRAPPYTRISHSKVPTPLPGTGRFHARDQGASVDGLMSTP